MLTSFFLKIILSTSRKKCNQAKSFIISFQEVGQKRRMVIKIEFTPFSHSPDCKIVSFKKGFKKPCIGTVCNSEAIVKLKSLHMEIPAY